MHNNNIIKFTCLSIFLASSLHAISLKESVEKTLNTNPEIIAEKENQAAFKKYIDENKSKYYPKINLDGKLERNYKKKNYNGTVATDIVRKDGFNTGITLDQLLYDGSSTSSLIKESKFNEKANKYKSLSVIEGIIYETVSSYNDVVQYQELLGFSKAMIKTNEDNLIIAKEKEEISGEILETYQVSSKLNFAKEKYLEEKDLQSASQSAFKRFVGLEVSGKECRAQINEELIPESLEKAIKKSLFNNYQILEQIQRIKVQREKIAQSDASFLPNLNLKLRASFDDDLALDERGVENERYGQVNLSWNLYNGGSDRIKTKREKIFLSEEKKRLEAISNRVVESLKVNYQRYYKNKERISILKEYVKANANIVDVYKNEFEAGTRTFVDILNAQTEYYQSKKSLVNREFELYNNYYSILSDLSILSPSILNSSSECVKVEEVKVETQKKEEEDDDLGLDEASLEENTTNTSEEVKEEVEEKPLNNNDSLAFLTITKKAYTLNLATTKGLDRAQRYITKYNLNKNNSFAYSFGPQMSNAKVIYGIFDSIKQAKEALKNLPEEVRKTGPYVDNIDKHKKLYYKYH